MHPILFKFILPFNLPVIGNEITIYTYGFCSALGFLFGYLLLIYRAKKNGINQDSAGDVLFYSAIIGIIGARLSYVFVNWNYYSDNLSEIHKIYNGGIIFYGGAVTGLAGGIIISLIKKINAFDMLDLAAPSLTLGHFFGRIGCYMYGCCHGAVCDKSHFFSAVFPKNSPAFLKQVKDGLIDRYSGCAMPVIATQVIEAAFLLILTFFLLFYDKKFKKFKGELFALYLLIYSMFRFTIEFFRGDYEKEFIFFNLLTLSQMISLGLFIIALSIIINRGKAKK